MSSLALAVLVCATEPVAVCHSDTAVLTVVLFGVEVDVGADRFVLRGTWRGPAGEEISPRAVIAGGTSASGEAFQLTLGDRWVLRRGDEELPLRIPRVVRRAKAVQILGVGPGQVWLAAPGVIARVDLADATVAAGRVGARAHTALPLAIGEEALVAVAGDLFACTAPTACERVVQLPAVVSKVVAGPRGWLLAAGGREAGLYRAPASMPTAADRLIAGDVVALCDAGDGEAWAVLARDDEVRVVAASTDTPAVRPFSPAEVFNHGLALAEDPAVVAHVLRVARVEAWPELEELALMVMTDERAPVRQHAAEALGQVSGARATAALWLLGRDPVAQVRVEAVHASAARCQSGLGVTCPHALSVFLEDLDTEVAWTARDLLLGSDPRAALDGAPADYKIDAIAALVGRLQRHGDLVAERALEMLATDPDPGVRAAARMALAGARR